MVASEERVGEEMEGAGGVEMEGEIGRGMEG